VRIVVRPVESPDELKHVLGLISAQFPPRRSAPARARDELRDRFAVDRTLMLVAEVDQEIVGGALGRRTGDVVKVDVIALVPEARRLGIGRRLMVAIEAESIRLGAHSIYLGGANTQNRDFYWRLGYQGRRSLMQKSLPAARNAGWSRT